MLLKRADSHFLQSSTKSLSVASEIYERLVRRLSFVRELVASGNTETVLHKSLMDFETLSLCLEPTSQLLGILEEAQARLARLQLGQDMFGQNEIWAPRLSYFYYGERIKEMITSYKSLTKELAAYQNNDSKATEQREAVSKVRELVQSEGAAVQTRLDALLNENGPLQATAYRIRALDPIMKEQQRHLKDQMQLVADQIKDSINFKKLLEAFTTMASSKSKGEAAKNALKSGHLVYQALTVVNDADGGSIDKKLLIKKVTTCGDTLDSLTQAISAGKEGSVDLEDPEAVKVVTNKENISKLLDQFRNILPEAIRQATNKDLDNFLDTVVSRNNAVLEYNAMVHSVQELQSIKKQQAVMIESLANHKLQSVDPSLPSIVNWLCRTRDDLSLAIMQQLNYASRAIRYWGLVEGLPLDRPGPLRGAVELEQIQSRLKQNFDAALNDYAGSTWNKWGGKDSWGRLYKLSAEQLNALKERKPDGKGRLNYSVNIPISPESSGMAGIGTNVRIRQIRLWLANAYVDPAMDDSHRQIMTITLTHTGDEIIQKSDTQSLSFNHAPVKISFRYHCGNVKSLENAKAAAVDGEQVIESEMEMLTISARDQSAIAPIGPFTTWTATIREIDNPGLDLTRVTGAWLEFWGRSKPM